MTPLFALLLAFSVSAQEAPKKKQMQTAHRKATPEQIRKFEQLEKKQKK